MITFSLRGWSAWAPGLEGSEAWREWARAPAAPELEGSPKLEFVPAMQRRRFSRLSRMALQVAFEATPPELLASVASVFASRHGEAQACVALLSDIARGLPISPTAFSHSVHNTQGGLFSIAAANAEASSSIAAGLHTFSAGLLEAVAVAARRKPEPCLLVVADEPRPAMFSAQDDELPTAFALALLLDEGRSGLAPAFRMELGPPREEDRVAERRLPEALQFLAWMLAGESVLELPYGRRAWRFERL